jgi:hypothetical protein
MAGSWPDLVPLPPSSVTGPLGEWLVNLSNILNSKVARASYFSAPTPPSTLTSVPGYLAINMSPSQSTDSRVWVHGGTGTNPTGTGYVVLRTQS